MAAEYKPIIDWIPGLPRIPYRRGVGQWEGVVMHQTASTSAKDTARSERAYEAAHWQDAFVHEFVDAGNVVQVADPSYIAYGAGAKANPRFIHLELCSAQTQADFEQSFDRWCWRAAYYLSVRQFGVTTAKADGSGTLWAHADVTRYLGGTTHTDPITYLARWGKTWSDVITSVQRHHDEIIRNDKEDEEMKEELEKLKQEIEDLKAQMSMTTVPAWAEPAVNAATATGLIDTPTGGSYDFYRLLTVLHRRGVL